MLEMCWGERRSLEAVSARSMPASRASMTIRSSGRRPDGPVELGAWCWLSECRGSVVQWRTRLMWPGLRRSRQAISAIGMPALVSLRMVRASGRWFWVADGVGVMVAQSFW